MLRIPGQLGRDVCDRGIGLTRRDLMRVGGSALLGLTLGDRMNCPAIGRIRMPRSSELF